jgi:hypothetical protein
LPETTVIRNMAIIKSITGSEAGTPIALQLPNPGISASQGKRIEAKSR